MASRIGARAKLREYLMAHVGVVLDSDGLRAVAGTSEWARRVRELRDEEGLDIASHNDDSSLRPGQYILRSHKPRPHFARGNSPGDPRHRAGPERLHLSDVWSRSG